MRDRACSRLRVHPQAGQPRQPLAHPSVPEAGVPVPRRIRRRDAPAWCRAAEEPAQARRPASATGHHLRHGPRHRGYDDRDPRARIRVRRDGSDQTILDGGTIRRGCLPRLARSVVAQRGHRLPLLVSLCGSASTPSTQTACRSFPGWPRRTRGPRSWGRDRRRSGRRGRGPSRCR